MSFWISAVTQRRSDGRIFEAEDILRLRFEDRFWGLGERTPNRRLLRKGKAFGYAHGTKIYEVEHGVLLDNCQIWQQPRAIDGLLTDLAKYGTEDQSGRQFPAGAWSIDFLCTDRSTGKLVVVELKRGRTSDATVGQLLRRMSWIKEHVAEPHQNLRGIIIAREIDEALRYSVKGLPGISALTYRVDSAAPFGDVATRTPR